MNRNPAVRPPGTSERLTQRFVTSQPCCDPLTHAQTSCAAVHLEEFRAPVPTLQMPSLFVTEPCLTPPYREICRVIICLVFCLYVCTNP